MHENFTYYLKHYTPILQASRPDAAAANKIRQWVPPSLASFLCEEGFRRFHNGLFSLCDPDDFRSILALIFKADKDFHHKDCHVVGFSAFGVLQCWSKRLANFQINLPETSIYCRALTVPNWSPKASPNHLVAGVVPDKDAADFLDFRGEPMFDRCVEAYGSLEEGQCLGFVPALAISGAFSPMRSVEHIKRLSAAEHFTILAQLEEFQLVAVTAEEIVPVRSLG
ncbi:DUF1851 domain-containing protein [Mesorhizobium sp. RP14(2022)]|uniref:DUF1851 domain-containing protein n=1 Tax=Mesorhizobium liriopis TaxID=2953882 RepID=A0ABT1CAA6_9HYPH|nr:GAD-like domain-containing protein [Mesorhizobium liriopis]MCO6051745.1 DUF1851 domain-containing protein [Mesorhizobium liriopis]